MKKEDALSLSDQCQAIILGSLLGDGLLKIHKGYANARFSFKHTILQEEYFSWKVEQLKEISSEHCVFTQKPSGFSTNEMLRYQSCALEALTKLYRLTNRRGKLLVRRTWLNQMTPLSLLIWWLDDGSIVSNGRKGVLCTDGFDEQSVKRLSQYLKVVWKIETHVGAVGRKRSGTRPAYFRLWFSTEELKKFLRLTLPYFKIESLLPKMILLYKDPELLQRWISEVATLSGIPLQTVERSVEEKKRKWKRYRE